MEQELTDLEWQHPGAAFLASMFGVSTEAPVYLCSLLNTRDNADGGERKLTTRAPDDIASFARRWDVPGRGTFFCVSTLKPGLLRRAKANLAELNCLHADIDFKTVVETPDEVRRIVGQLMLPPSTVNFSGHGLHLFWLFKEGIEATPYSIAEVERLLRLLSNHVGGDPAVAEVARLMRLPGSHNTKDGEHIEVVTEIERELRYTLDELAEWLEIVSPVIHRRNVGNGRTTNPWLEVAARFGLRPPIDVEERLEAMQFHGPGDSAIHPTQLAVSAALINRGGHGLEEVVTILLDATRAAAGAAGHDWNWRREEATIRNMCATWVAKHPAPEIAPAAPEPDIAAIEQPPAPPEPEPEPEPDVAAELPPPAAEAPAVGKLPIIALKAGELPRSMRESEQALIAAGLPIFVRASALTYPVTETVPAADGRNTTVAKLKPISLDLLLAWLARSATFVKFDKRSNAWLRTDPSRQLAAALLANEGAWAFPRVIGIATTPVLRTDGSLLAVTGYDEVTQLFVSLDPALAALQVSERPTRTEAQAALAALTDLLAGFVFDTTTDRAAGLALILTAVARSSMPVAPLHLVRAHQPGTGKSHLVDVAAAISIGRYCPVITMGKTPEEAEKRLGALLREGVPLISLDNSGSDLKGDLLCQLAERPTVRMRILGLSEAPEYECRSALAATGNNISVRGDMVRRTITCNLSADMERPELRRFPFDPVVRVLANRATYLAAAFTIIRAYQAAGSPAVCEPVGSYGKWSNIVRAPLIWLGEADPVESMEAARQEDPDLADLREFFEQWRQHLADRGSVTAFEISETACEQDAERKSVRPEFRDLLGRIAGDHGGVSTNRLGWWLRGKQGRVIDGLKLESPQTSESKARRYHVRGLTSGKLKV